MHTSHAVLIGAGAAFFLLLALGRRRLAFSYLKYASLLLIAAIFLSPFVWLICTTIKDKSVLNEYLFLPPPNRWSSATLNFSSYRELFKPTQTMNGTIYFWRYLANSLFLACATTLVQLAAASAGGYALAHYDFRGKRLTMTFMLGSMMLPGLLLMAPTYKLIVNAGFVDSYASLIVPAAISVYGMFFFRQAILGIPKELIEAGRIDGCSELGIYLRLVMPLVRPVTGALCLTSFLAAWNNYLAVNIFINDQEKLTLPVVMKNYMSQYDQNTAVYMAGTLVALIPPAIVFLAMQREFVSGLAAGAVKG